MNVFYLFLFLLQGKSLSLICGALSWLTDYEEKRRQEAAALLQEGEASLTTAAASTTSSASAEPDWITDFVQKKAERDLVSKLKVGDIWITALGFFFVCAFFVLLKVTVSFLFQEEELKRKKREERMEMIRNNVHLKYAGKRKVSAQKPVLRAPCTEFTTNNFPVFNADLTTELRRG